MRSEKITAEAPKKPKPGDLLVLWDTGLAAIIIEVSRKTFSISPNIARIRLVEIAPVPGQPGFWRMLR
jgi:hypothetical protein